MQTHCREFFTCHGYRHRRQPVVSLYEIGPCEKLENAVRMSLSLSLSSPQCQAASQFISQPVRAPLAPRARHSYPTTSLSLLAASPRL